MKTGIALAIVVISTLVVVSGCGQAEAVSRVKTVPVSGTVTYKGVPVVGASVGFIPDAPPGPNPTGRGAFGRTDAKGQFELMTFVAGDGVVPGSYKVTVTKIESPPATGAVEGSDDYDDPGISGPPPETKHLLPKRYADARLTDLNTRVEDGKPMELTFDLVE